MLKQERHNIILEEIKKHSKVHSTILSKKLKVSEDTVRRDLKELSENGHLKKVHGGAMANPFAQANITTLPIEDQSDRQKLIQKGLCQMNENSVMIIEGTTTNVMLIDHLPRLFEATIFTNSILIAAKLMDFPNIECLLLGGKLSKKKPYSSGLDVINSLKDIHVDKLIMESGGIDKKTGISDCDREYALTLHAMINASREVAVLCLSNAIDSPKAFRIAPVSKINTLITELDEDNSKLEPYRNLGIKIL